MTMTADGTDVRALVADVDAFDPEWSPEAATIAFTKGGDAAFQPSYSPTGRRIVFCEKGVDGCGLFLFDPTGRQMVTSVRATIPGCRRAAGRPDSGPTPGRRQSSRDRR